MGFASQITFQMNNSNLQTGYQNNSYQSVNQTAQQFNMPVPLITQYSTHGEFS